MELVRLASLRQRAVSQEFNGLSFQPISRLRLTLILSVLFSLVPADFLSARTTSINLLSAPPLPTSSSRTFAIPPFGSISPTSDLPLMRPPLIPPYEATLREKLK